MDCPPATASCSSWASTADPVLWSTADCWAGRRRLGLAGQHQVARAARSGLGAVGAAVAKPLTRWRWVRMARRRERRSPAGPTNDRH